MFDGASLPLDENICATSEVVRISKAAGVDVEAELGKVGNAGDGSEGSGDAADIFTNVEESALFIEKTGVDALAIAIGNLHGNYVATPQRVKEIRERNDLPLVLHGGSGTSEADFKACACNGIAKINVATAMQMAVTKKIQEYLSRETKPNYIDMKWQMIEASEETAAYHLRLFGSEGKATF